MVTRKTRPRKRSTTTSMACEALRTGSRARLACRKSCLSRNRNHRPLPGRISLNLVVVGSCSLIPSKFLVRGPDEQWVSAPVADAACLGWLCPSGADHPAACRAGAGRHLPVCLGHGRTRLCPWLWTVVLRATGERSPFGTMRSRRGDAQHCPPLPTPTGGQCCTSPRSGSARLDVTPWKDTAAELPVRKGAAAPSGAWPNGNGGWSGVPRALAGSVPARWPRQCPCGVLLGTQP